MALGGYQLPPPYTQTEPDNTLLLILERTENCTATTEYGDLACWHVVTRGDYPGCDQALEAERCFGTGYRSWPR